MIDLYLSSNKNFEFNGDMVLKPSVCDLEVEINGLIEVNIEHPYDSEKRWRFIEEDNLVRVPYPGKVEGQLFYIYDKVKTMTGVKAKARHIFFDLAKEILIDCRVVNCNGQEALMKILDGTGYSAKSNIMKINSAYYVRKNILNQALISEEENSFVNRWGGELDVDNFTVYMNERIGGEYGVKFKYGRDLISLNENTNNDSCITRIIPVGFNGITIPEMYVNSPLIDKYRKIKTEVIKFENIKVKENDGEEGYQTLEDAQEALRVAAKELFDEGIDKLKYQIEVEIAKLEDTLKYEQYKDILNTGLGDTVEVEHLDIGIEIKTRVIKFTYDCIKEKYKTIVLGNYIENYLDNQNNIDEILEKITNKDGTVNAVEVSGVLNAINVKMRAMKDIAQKQEIRALLCEDLDPSSPTYGAMCYGTMGFMIASERTTDNRDWDWRTFGTGKGFFADLIVAGTMLADRIKAGMLMSLKGNTWINMDTGEFHFEVLGEKTKIKFGGEGLELTGGNFKIGNTDSGEMVEHSNESSKYVHSDGSYTKISNAGLQKYVSGNAKNYQYLTYVTTAWFDSGVQATFTVPDEFKNKPYSVTVSIVSTQVPTTTSPAPTSGGYFISQFQINNLTVNNTTVTFTPNIVHRWFVNGTEYFGATGRASVSFTFTL